MIASVMHVAFAFHMRPTDVLEWTQQELALCLAYISKVKGHG